MSKEGVVFPLLMDDCKNSHERCEELFDYFPKAAAYSNVGDLFIVAVTNDENESKDREPYASSNDIILKLSYLSRTIEKYYVQEGLHWISDIAVMQNDDILICEPENLMVRKIDRAYFQKANLSQHSLHQKNTILI